MIDGLDCSLGIIVWHLFINFVKRILRNSSLFIAMNCYNIAIQSNKRNFIRNSLLDIDSTKNHDYLKYGACLPLILHLIYNIYNWQ